MHRKSNTNRAEWLNERLGPKTLILLYFILLSPFALQFTFYLPDEHHYIDAAIAMLKNGDYLSPVNPNGGYRFLKPIFTYWSVLASYLIFGISQPASRLPFLIAACFALWMTYKNALLAFQNKKIALTAMMMLGSSLVFNRSVGTVLTDIWQLLFLEVLSYGVIGLLVSSDRRKYYLTILYLGAAMAVTVKGLVAVAFFVFSVIFLLLNPWRRYKPAELIYLPPAIAALAISLFWYVAVCIQHGPEALMNFYGDQVGVRVTHQLPAFIRNFGYSLLTVALLLFPLCIPAWRSIFPIRKRNYTGKISQINPVIAFSWYWILSMVIMASFLSRFYFRYFIPVGHMLALFLAFSMYQNSQPKTVANWLKGTMTVTFLLFLLTNLLVAVCTISLKQNPVYLLLVLLLVFFGIALFRLPSTNTDLLAEKKIFLYTIAIFTGISFIGRQFGFPDSGEQITNRLRELQVSPGATVQFYGKLSTASRVRIASKGDYYWPVSNFEPDSVSAPYLILDEANRKKLETTGAYGYNIIQISEVWNDYPVLNLLRFPDQRQLKQLKASHSEKYYLAVRNQPSSR